jgi:hypothetical protein
MGLSMVANTWLPSYSERKTERSWFKVKAKVREL